MNGAKCEDGLNDHTCVCVDGFTGESCQNAPHVETEFTLDIPIGQTGSSAKAVIVERLGVVPEAVTGVIIEAVNAEGTAIRIRDTLIFTVRTDSSNSAAKIISKILVEEKLPAGWKMLRNDLGGCDINAVGGSRGAASDLPADILTCVRTYGWPLDLPIDVDIYMLQDMSTSFADDKQQLLTLAPDITATLDALFETYRVGLGSFVDVNGPYCYQNAKNLVTNMNADELTTAVEALEIHSATEMCSSIDGYLFLDVESEDLCNAIKVASPEAEYSNGKCKFIQTGDQDNAGGLAGESSLVGLQQTGLQAVDIGFESDYLRVVLMVSLSSTRPRESVIICASLTCVGDQSTDDEYKTPGFMFSPCTDLKNVQAGEKSTTCSCANAGTAPHCAQIPTVDAVRQALADSRLTPIFAISPPPQASLAEREEKHQELVGLYQGLLDEIHLGGLVLPLEPDSSNFVDILVIALGQILETNRNIPFPDECEWTHRVPCLHFSTRIMLAYDNVLLYQACPGPSVHQTHVSRAPIALIPITLVTSVTAHRGTLVRIVS
jgi:hypothetical protein